jgi:predicted glycosyltransferase
MTQQEKSEVVFYLDNHLGIKRKIRTLAAATAMAKEIDAQVIDIFKGGKFLTSLIRSSTGDNRWICPLG